MLSFNEAIGMEYSYIAMDVIDEELLLPVDQSVRHMGIFLNTNFKSSEQTNGGVEREQGSCS